MQIQHNDTASTPHNILKSIRCFYKTNRSIFSRHSGLLPPAALYECRPTTSHSLILYKWWKGEDKISSFRILIIPTKVINKWWDFGGRTDLWFEPGVIKAEEKLAEGCHSMRSSRISKFSLCLESNPTGEKNPTLKLRQKELVGD